MRFELLHSRLRPLQAILFLFVLVLGLFSVHADATWTHLATGAWISRAGRLPGADPFSYVSGGAPWRAHDWLFDWLLYRCFEAAGAWGVIVLKAAIIAAAFALLLPLTEGLPLLGTGALALAACGAWPGFTELPAAADFLMLALLLRWLAGSEAYRVSLLWRVAAVAVAWANLHPAGAWLGVGVAAVAAFRRGLGGTRSQKLGWATVSVAVLLAVWSNPHGGGAWAAEGAGTEWSVGPGLFNVYGLTLAAGAVAAWVCLQEHFVLAVAAMLLAAISLLRPAVAPLYLLACAPLLALGLSRWVQRVPPTGRRVAGLAALLVLSLLSYAVSVSLTRGRARGFSTRQNPEGAIAFLQARGVRGRMFNDLASAPYLLWRAAPSRPIFADPRPGIYDPGLLEDARRWPERWPALAAAYKFDYAVLANVGGGYPTRALDEDPGWALAYFDDASLVYLRKGGPNDPGLVAQAFANLTPNHWLKPVRERAFADAASRLKLEQEAARAASAAPASAAARLAQAYVLQRVGRGAPAEDAWLRGAELGLWKPELVALSARCLELAGRWGDAAKSYGAARRFAERVGEPALASQAQTRLGAGWLERGETRRARGLLESALRLDPGNVEAGALLRKL